MDHNTTFTEKCHTGNTLIYQEPDGGGLYIGGWMHGAFFTHNTYVIDLTGKEKEFLNLPTAYDQEGMEFMQYLPVSYAGWLSLPFPDYGIPRNLSSKSQWEGITHTIRGLLRKGRDVLVACHGGHGRSGIFCAIVGYILNIQQDRTWASPVEKIRKLHCTEAVETYSQEKFVYDVLGLRIQIQHVYADDPFDWSPTGKGGIIGASQYSYQPCPICGIQTVYIGTNGMCLGCQTKYAQLAPEREDLTVEDIKNKGLVEHSCNKPGCMGIWTAKKCRHVVHDMIVNEGLCPTCQREAEEEAAYAEKKLAGESEFAECGLCKVNSMYAKKFGLCYDCAYKLHNISEAVDEVHNTITDPYRNYEHTCSAGSQCVGIVIADECKHAVHNLEVQDGLCPDCYDRKHGTEVK